MRYFRQIVLAAICSVSLLGGTALAANSVLTVSSPANITWPSKVSLGNPGNVSITATSDNTGTNISYSSATASVCSASGSGLSGLTASVVINTAGVCTINFNQVAGGSFGAATQVPKSFTINKASQTIDFVLPNNFTSIAFGGAVPPLTATASSELAVSYATSDATICTVAADNSVTLLKIGKCTVTASQPGDSNYNSAASVVRSFDITKGTAFLTFLPPADTPINNSPPTLSATSTNTETPVSYVLVPASTSGCTVSGTGTLTFASPPGTCSIKASQAASAKFNAPTAVTVSFNVTPALNMINFPALAGAALSGSAPSLAATATAGAVVYTSNSAACSVSGSTLTLLATGACSITASAAATGNYAAATSVTQTFQISANAQSITFPALANTTFIGAAPVPSATATSSLAVTYSSTSQTVCTVLNGVITLKAAGACSITALQSGNASYAAATPVTRSFDIVRSVNTITFPTPANIVLGNPPPALKATASSKLGVSYALTSPAPSPAVCSVLPAGAITILAPGTCTITASQGGNGNYVPAADVPASFSVIAPAGASLTFAQPANVSIAGTPPTLTASSSAGVVSYVSKTTAVCGIGAGSGLISFVKVGACAITASNGTASVTRSFNITAAATNVITFPLPPNTPFDVAPPTLGATATSGTPVSYASISPACTVTTAGVITFAASGACLITASQAAAGPFPAAASVARQFTVTPGANVITFPSNPALPDTAFTSSAPALAATATSGLPVSYTSNSSGICTIASGNITFVAGGSCSITASQPGNASWSAAAKVTVSFAVQVGDNIITFNKPADTLFTSAPPAIHPTASSGLTVSLASNSPAVCTVTSPGGVVKFVKGGVCLITASQAGNATYSVAEPATQTFTVLPGVNVIAFPPLDAVNLDGKPTVPTANATKPAATASSGLPVSYASKTPNVCAVTAGGTITLVRPAVVTLPSPCTITASQAGNGSYQAAATVDQTFTVNQIPTTTTTGNGSPAPVQTNAALSFVPLAAQAPLNLLPTPTTTLSASDLSPLLGQSITLTAVVTPSPAPAGGDVTFKDGATIICSAVPLDMAATATAICSTAFSTSGPHDITATFNGNVDYAVSTSDPLTITVRDQRPWTLATLAQFLGLRSDLMAANAPDQSREMDRLNEAQQASGQQGVASADGAPASTATAEAASADEGWKPTTAIGLNGSAQPLSALLQRNLYTSDPVALSGLGVDATPVDVSPLARLLHLQGATEGQTQFSFATSLHDVARFAADADARKVAEAGLAFSDRPVGSRAARPNPFDAWVEGKFTTFRDGGFDSNQDGRFSLLSIGADYVLSPNLLIGAMAQFDSMDQLKSVTGTHASGHGWMAGPYATLRLSDGLFLQTRGAWGKSSNEVSPYLTYTDNFETERWLLAASLNGRWSHGAWTVRPAASFTYMVDDAKSYTDHFGVTIPELKSRLGQAKIGPDIGYSFHLGDSAVVEPHASLQLIWDYANDATAAGYSTITPDPASSAGARGKADFGLHVVSSSGMVLDATGSYDGIGSKGYQAITGAAKVSVPLN